MYAHYHNEVFCNIAETIYPPFYPLFSTYTYFPRHNLLFYKQTSMLVSNSTFIAQNLLLSLIPYALHNIE